MPEKFRTIISIETFLDDLDSSEEYTQEEARLKLLGALGDVYAMKTGAGTKCQLIEKINYHLAKLNKATG